MNSKLSSILLKPRIHPPSLTFPTLFSTTSQTPSPHILIKCAALLRACDSTHRIKQVHAFSIRHNVPLHNPDMVKNLLSTIVSLSAPMSYAHNVFKQLWKPNVFFWNTMIRGYSLSGNSKRALALYREMLVSGVRPDTHTYPSLLNGLNVRVGEVLHSVTLRNGFESLLFVKNSLLHMYATCADIASAHKVLDSMHERDIVVWNTGIDGFALNGKLIEAFSLFRGMRLEGVEANGFTVVSLLSACAEFGALELGITVHMYLLKLGLIENLHVSNSLLDFYAKCGCIREAKQVFSEMRERNLVSWNSLVVGMAVNGFGEEALELFKEMERQNILPDDITFVGVLHACSHSGMLDEGFDCFRRMEEKYGIMPRIEHFGCMVDLLGRTGLVKQAYEFILNMPMQANAVIWRTLLGACKLHGDLGLGEIARSHLSTLEPKHSGDYVLLSNLYAAKHRWSDVQIVRRLMKEDDILKTPGYSLVELGNRDFEFVRGDRSNPGYNHVELGYPVSEFIRGDSSHPGCSRVEFGNRVYEFVTGDMTHPWSRDVYAQLEEIIDRLKLEGGYVPHSANVLADIEEEEKEQAPSYHSEKIAIAFMLLKSAPWTQISIMKNLRVCADCHAAIKIISKVYAREIIIIDSCQLHRFKRGFCSCEDHWFSFW